GLWEGPASDFVVCRTQPGVSNRRLPIRRRILELLAERALGMVLADSFAFGAALFLAGLRIGAAFGGFLLQPLLGFLAFGGVVAAGVAGANLHVLAMRRFICAALIAGSRLGRIVGVGERRRAQQCEGGKQRSDTGHDEFLMGA
ncbi:MAG TPA: hypothetical protein VFM56_09150, partial [Solimonas sp.]|nr:hypothetical protein [Solimonas sp.]